MRGNWAVTAGGKGSPGVTRRAGVAVRSRRGRARQDRTSHRRSAHLRARTAHRRARLVGRRDDTTVSVIELETGEILSTHLIEPTKSYWRVQQKSPGRWPGR